MVLPIVAYGNPVLRKVGVDITSGYPGLKKLIEDMWETLYNSKGVGLAAPQVDKDIRLFIVDSVQVIENLDVDEKDLYPGDEGYKGAFINARIAETEGEEWPYNEGCLSIPKIREDISRRRVVALQYQDENFESHQKIFQGLTARVILHEYDHLEGKLFIDHVSPLKRKLMRGKLSDISKGKIKVNYKMLFPDK